MKIPNINRITQIIQVGTADYQTPVWDDTAGKYVPNSILNIDSDTNKVGIGCLPSTKLEVVDNSGSAQQTWGYTQGSIESSWKTDSAGKTTIETSGANGFSIVANSAEAQQIKDTEILNNVDFYFVNSGSGLPTGEISTKDNATTTTFSGTGAANKTQITVFSVNGESNLVTPDHTNDHLTIVKAGLYKAECNITVASTVAVSSVIGIEIYKNNGATGFDNCHANRSLSGTADTGAFSFGGNIRLAINDTIEVWIWNDTNTNAVLVSDITLNLLQIGG